MDRLTVCRVVSAGPIDVLLWPPIKTQQASAMV
jgi:hypothetical protein